MESTEFKSRGTSKKERSYTKFKAKEISKNERKQLQISSQFRQVGK